MNQWYEADFTKKIVSENGKEKNESLGSIEFLVPSVYTGSILSFAFMRASISQQEANTVTLSKIKFPKGDH